MKKIALLVGCNYPNRDKEWPDLRGSHNDVNVVRATLIDVFGFHPSNIEVLMDKPGTKDEAMPTGENIKSALERLIFELREGDVLFFHFSGHGTRFPWEGKLVEAIVPCDLNLITNMDFRKLVDRVPQLASFVFFSDSCHSGDLIDKEKEQIGPNTSLQNGTLQSDNYKSRFVPPETVLDALLETLPTSRGPNNMTRDVETIMLHLFRSNASLLFEQTRTRSRLPEPLKPDQGILLVACQSDEYSVECVNDEGHFGVFTSAVQVIIKEKLLSQPVTNKQLVMKAREIIPTRILKSRHNRDPKQHPCLYCSNENVDRSFLSISKSESQPRPELQHKIELQPQPQLQPRPELQHKIELQPQPQLQPQPACCVIQ